MSPRTGTSRDGNGPENQYLLASHLKEKENEEKVLLTYKLTLSFRLQTKEHDCHRASIVP
jgi:hypothetical protein